MSVINSNSCRPSAKTARSVGAHSVKIECNIGRVVLIVSFYCYILDYTRWNTIDGQIRFRRLIQYHLPDIENA
jgi:hypothetical protein